jgi:C1A family cysteine protease
MRILLFSLFTIVECNSFEHFNSWVNTFQIEFQSEFHFYNTLHKWINNDNYITSINSEGRSYTLGHNQFSGMDQYDFQNYVNNNVTISLPKQIQESNETFLPESVDWRNNNSVTPVKDQGQCGSCWAFSTTGSLEGIYAIQSGELVSFSEQQLVDCDNFRHGGKDHGCDGGLMDNAFAWINENNGLCSEASYPYIGEKEKCQTICDNLPNSQIQSWIDVDSSDHALMSAVALQPVSVAIEADQIDFQLYKSGVLTSECGTTLDHGVLVIGYGSEGKEGTERIEGTEDYYLVKNSWGTSWGDEGYIKLGRGPQYNDGQGQCGILLQASYPVL